jgi:hypothetical protein
MKSIKLGKYLNLENFCNCSQTYYKYAKEINPTPKNPASIVAIKELNQYIIEPVIEYFGREKFNLTYGFCSPDLKRFLDKKDPLTGKKNGRIAPAIDQHMAHETKKNGKYYCERLGAACDFLIIDVSSNQLVEWILEQKLPFDSLYFYGNERPIHISYGPQHKRDIWRFNPTGQPTKKGIEHWLESVRNMKSV